VSTIEGQLLKSYDLGIVQLVVGGIPIGGFGEDGGIEFESDSDLWEVNVGATGLTTFSKVNNDLLFAIVTVMETSLAYAALGGLLKTQQLNPLPVIVPLPFLMVDPSTGDTVSSVASVFTQRPNQNKGRVAGERIFRIALPGAGATNLYGVANVV
jgi:hypothetical protein